MKVYLNNYRHHWLSPFTMIDYLFFWTAWSKCHRDKSWARALSNSETGGNWSDRPDWVEVWSEHLMPISKFIQTILDWIHPKIDFVKIDRWDTWSMDQSLGQIVLPMLRQLKSTSHGVPLVEDADVPEELKSSSVPPIEKEHGTDANYFKRWDWALSEMIFAFESKLDKLRTVLLENFCVCHILTLYTLESIKWPSLLSSQITAHRQSDCQPNCAYQSPSKRSKFVPEVRTGSFPR